MNNPISERVRKVKPSATIAISSKAMEMRSAGINVISMSAGEPDFDTPQHIKDAAKAAMDNGMTKYTQVDGVPDLKEAIIKKFRNDNELVINLKIFLFRQEPSKLYIIFFKPS